MRIFAIEIHGFKKWFKCNTTISKEDLIQKFKQCKKPWIEMESFGTPISELEYALLEQNSGLIYSIYFNVDENDIDVWEGTRTMKFF